MAAEVEYSSKTKRNSNPQLLEELDAQSESLHQSHITRITATHPLSRTSVPLVPSAEDDNIDTANAKFDDKPSNKPQSRRMSLSPWRSRPKHDDSKAHPTKLETKKSDDTANSAEKKGIWGWKPMRALSHIGMQKLSCLFSVEVVTAQNLPSSMNGLRLSVCVRKKEKKDGAVQTMPSRVAQGVADYEETLLIRCHVYCNRGSGKQQLQFEPRLFLIYLVAVDAKELNFGRSSVDLSQLIQESIEKSQQGTRPRQWDMRFSLSGKAKGGELVLKLGFQIMEKDGGAEICNKEDNLKSNMMRKFSSSFARQQSKTSFSMPSSRITSRSDAWTPSLIRAVAGDIEGMDDLILDDPNPFQDSSPSTQKFNDGKDKVENSDLPDFDVVDKGIEVQKKEEDGGNEFEKSIEVKSTSSEVVKEIVHDQLHRPGLTELESIARKIKALESMMGEDYKFKKIQKIESQRLDADEEIVTRKFLQMLEDQETTRGYKINQPEIPRLQLEGHELHSSAEGKSKVYLPDLGKGLGCVVQTRGGGYLASMNPLDNATDRNDTPKLAMQMSKPFVLESQEALSGFKLFQKLAHGIGVEELSSQVFSLMPIDELMGKTAEQIAFEGIASAIIQGRNKEGASSSAARIVSALKGMANAMSSGRKEGISTGLWGVDENPLTAEKILAFSMQKIETMVVEGLKIQADMAEKEAPFDVSAPSSKRKNNDKELLASAISLEHWIKHQCYSNTTANFTLIFTVQLRDPTRRYEAVGGPMMVLVHAISADTKGNHMEDEKEKRFKVTSMHVAGFKVRSGTSIMKNAWDTEKMRLTAMQWLIEYYGLGRAGKKGKHVFVKGQDLLWSISSQIMADMWLKTMRNPNLKLV